MDFRIASIPRFLYSHYFFGGVRQGVGMLLPVLVLGGIFGEYAYGLVATFGAQCLAIIDQPGGPQRHRTNEMLGGAFLATMAVAITGAVSTYPVLLWLAIIGQCFIFSMFSVFGKRGGLIGFGGLLIMTLTMHSPMTPSQVLPHALATLGGALFYLAFSLAFSRVFWLREERQAMSVALFATADYMAARSRFYDETTDLDDIYRELIQSQSVMTEKHQSARDIVLRTLPRGRGYGDSERVMLWNMFVNMLQLLDTLVASHTDYASLRRVLAGHDCLLFMRDALVKMSLELNRIALDVSRGRAVQYRSSPKAELRAIEYEIEQFKQQGMSEREPETLALIVQVLRRLRNASRIVNKLADHTDARMDAQPTDELRIDKSLTQFMSRQELRIGMITSNLRLDSPYFRYAVRVTLAAALAMGLIGQWMTPQVSSAHSYWVLLTIVIIMKPGFALTRQRNGWRLMGTLIGCLLALLLFRFTAHPTILFGVLLIACIMGNSLLQLNYMASAIFNTLFVVMVFHFVAPGTVSMEVIGERALDTAMGCAIALICSYVLPWWEARYMKPLARAATNANREYLRTGMSYVRAMHAANAGAPPSEEVPSPAQADIAWRLARKNVHIAFSNYAEAFYRMMSEPRSHQVNVPEFNNLLIQNHIMASQITAAIPLLAGLKETPEPMRKALKGMVDLLDDSSPASTDLPNQFDTTGELAALAYPIKQMLRASTQIRQEMAAVADPPQSRPAAVAAPS
ncbi:Integral membrane protein YccS N-terminal domain-containing protein [Bordetella tumbae]|uniref:FUSC family protein n=1 Tax=Bordetella tumbae TaxID=1649139 RepID=UPI0039EF5F56